MKCQEPIPPYGEPCGGSLPCKSHEKCVSCGEWATRKCDYQGVHFVCGWPMCDKCIHTDSGVERR